MLRNLGFFLFAICSLAVVIRLGENMIQLCAVGEKERTNTVHMMKNGDI